MTIARRKTINLRDLNQRIEKLIAEYSKLRIDAPRGHEIIKELWRLSELRPAIEKKINLQRAADTTKVQVIGKTINKDDTIKQ
jgi:hypothetical protein